MKPRLLCLLLGLLGLPVASHAAVTMVWASEVGLAIEKSDGSPITSDFLVELGIFAAPFTPEATNQAEWQGKWTSFGSTPYNAADSYYSGITTLADNSQAPAGSQMYVWLRGPAQPDGTFESLLITDAAAPEWRVPDVAGTDQTTRPVVLEFLIDQNVVPRTSVVNPIPEPASSLLLGALGLAAVLCRKR